MNKKILAVAVAAAFSFNANAVIDITSSATAVKYASEMVDDGDTLFQVATDALNFTVPLGLNLPLNTTGNEYYLRIELENAEFATNTLDDDSPTITTAGTKVFALAAGGTAGSSYATFSYVNDGASLSTDVITFSFDVASATDLVVTDASQPITYTYKLFLNDDAIAALNTGVGATVTTSMDAVTFSSGQISTFVAQDNVAEVADGFTTFADTTDIANTDDDEANLGSILIAADTDFLDPADSGPVAAADVFTTPTTATASLTGDFSVGTWTLNTNIDCTTGSAAITVDADDDSIATAAAADYTSAVYLCVKVDGEETIPRVSSAYTLTLDGALNSDVSGDLGTIAYDTTSIKIDYITINPAYAQKIFLTNTSGSDAGYTTTFTLEDGSTATGGTGSVAANTMVTIKATDFMTITGTALRGSAVIEIEGNVSDIQASTQTVNLTTKDTDTVTLSVE